MSEPEHRGKHAAPTTGGSSPFTPSSLVGNHAQAPTPEPERAVPVAADQTTPAPVSDAPEAPATVAPAQAAHAAPGQTIQDVTASTTAAIDEARIKRQRNKRIAQVLGGVLAALAVVYAGGCLYFSSHFLPNTTIGSFDISNKSLEEASATLSELSGDYALEVEGLGLKFEVSSEDTGLRLDSETVVKNALVENDFMRWPLSFSGRQDLTTAMQATYDETGLADYVVARVDEFNTEAEDPTSATIAFNSKEDAFEIVPEKLGGKFDATNVLTRVEEAAFRMQDSVALGEDELLRPPILADDPRLAAAVETADGMLGPKVDFTLAGTTVATMDSETIASWLTLNDDLNPYLDPDKLKAWMEPVEHKYYTVGAKREFTNARGELVSVEGGAYGWELDHDGWWASILDNFDNKVKGEVEIPCLSVAKTLPDENGDDIGRVWVDVNLSTQHAVFYDHGEVIWEADIISGSPDGKHDTPHGTYEITNKESPSKLVGEMVGNTNKPEYEETVAYWMPFVGNAIGFHDATWQPGFGGSMYANGYGSHGCINLAYTNAEDLYAIIAIGTPVITHG